MELVYLYIRKYENIFENVGFNFSSNYVATFKDNYLLVDENTNTIKQYYGENVNNVVMFLGQNGVGKSSLLDILGMTRDDRCDDSYNKKSCYSKIKVSYFMLYHLFDDIYAFEFVDNSFFSGKNKISNIFVPVDKRKGALYKLPMGTIFKLKNGVFEYCDNIILNWRDKNRIKNKLEYAYITSDRYNSRINNRYVRYYDDYMFERKYFLEEKNYEYLYKYFVYLNEINNELLQEKSMYVKNSIDIKFNILDAENEVEEYLYERKQELDKLLGLKSEIQVQMETKFLKKKPQRDTRSMKKKFLHTFYAEAIEFYFLEQLVGWSKNEGLKIKFETPLPDIDELEKEIEKLEEAEKESIYSGTNDIMIFQYEYGLLQHMIRKHTDKNGNINFKEILLYTLKRVEVAAKGTIDIRDRQAMFDIIELLENLPKSYFKSRKNIQIDCGVENVDEKVNEFLKCYDRYYRIRNNEDGSNNIFKMLHIEISKMSEGQRIFLDIISKCVSAIYALLPGDSLVLLIDEPDRALHPELSRMFLDTLLRTINQCKDRKIQLVLTSHSPFIVTDVLPESVYMIDMEGARRKIRNDEVTFATNIYYLLMDSFMLKNTFGEYSYKEIKKITELLNEKERISREEMERIKKVIDRIGERTVKNKLLQLYKKHEESKVKLLEKLLIEADNTKLEKIKEILEND